MKQRYCSICGSPVSGPSQDRGFHIDGADYCKAHKPTPRPSPFDETIHAFCIVGDGGAKIRYQFWSDDKMIHSGRYVDDREAIDDFKKRFPDEFKKGAEVRVFDQ